MYAVVKCVILYICTATYSLNYYQYKLLQRLWKGILCPAHSPPIKYIL